MSDQVEHMDEDKETYIGDGVYSSFDGYQIRLRTMRYGREEFIYLESKVWENLKSLVENEYKIAP